MFHFNKKNNGKDRPNLGRGFFGLIGRDPRVDWVSIVAVSFIATVVLVALGLVKYYFFEADLSKKATPVKKDLSQSLNAEALDNVLKGFEIRAKLHNDLLRGYIGPSDPSY